MSLIELKRKYGYEELNSSHKDSLEKFLTKTQVHFDYSTMLNIKAFLNYADTGVNTRNAKEFNEILGKLTKD